MRTVHVHTGDPYDILIERGILDRCGAYVRELSQQAEKVVVVTDDNVAPHYFWRVLNSLEQNGLSVKPFIYPAGEASKHLGTVGELYQVLADFRMTRKDVIVALGGGVCGDMAGFAAATYRRERTSSARSTNRWRC